FPRFALYPERAPVVRGDAVGDGEPETRSHAHPLGGVAGVENARERFLANAVAVVAHSHHHRVALAKALDVDTALALDGLYGVDDEVHEHLVQLAGIAADERDVPIR